MIGPGKYDDLCTHARETAQAQGAILIIMDGAKGSGFSCQGPREVTVFLPNILRQIADQIERDGEGA